MSTISLHTKRLLVQILASLCQNPHIQNLVTGRIYRGSAKVVCAPGLNCYSCPAATFGCPIGSLQAVASGGELGISFYALGILFIFGAIFGRFICGFLCLFGLLQDLLYKIPLPKLDIPKSVDKPLRYLKYVVLVVLVLLLPALVFDEYGLGTLFFCKYLCPAGTIEAGIPLLLANGSLRSSIGGLFGWKLGIALALLLLSIFVYRPWCKYICPLGAFYGLFNKVSMVKLKVNARTCTSCGACTDACHMGVDVTGNINSTECIRCGACKQACPCDAITWDITGLRRRPERQSDKGVESGL